MRIVPHHLRVSLLSQRSQVRLYSYGFLHNYWRSDSLKMSDGLVNGSARELLSRFLRDKSWAERFLSRKVWENHVYHAGGVGMRQSAEENMGKSQLSVINIKRKSFIKKKTVFI